MRSVIALCLLLCAAVAAEASSVRTVATFRGYGRPVAFVRPVQVFSSVYTPVAAFVPTVAVSSATVATPVVTQIEQPVFTLVPSQVAVATVIAAPSYATYGHGVSSVFAVRQHRVFIPTRTIRIR